MTKVNLDLFFLSLRILVLFKKHKRRFLNLTEGRIALFCVDVDHTWQVKGGAGAAGGARNTNPLLPKVYICFLLAIVL